MQCRIIIFTNRVSLKWGPLRDWVVIFGVFVIFCLVGKCRFHQMNGLLGKGMFCSYKWDGPVPLNQMRMSGYSF